MGLVLGLVIGRFALTPSQVQVSGIVSVPGHQTKVVAFSYVKSNEIPGCDKFPVPPCFQTFAANVTSQGTYSLPLPNGRLYSVSTADSPAAFKSLTANSTCQQEIFLTLDSVSSSLSFDIACG